MKGRPGCSVQLAVAFVICFLFGLSYGKIERVTIDEFLTTETRNVKTLDSPTSGQVYSLYEGQSNRIRKMFEVSSSGVVTVRGPLVYTRGEANQYDVIIVQRAIGATSGGKAVTLRVTVRDRNNFSPTFPKSIYYGFIKEGAPENTVVQGIGDCYAEDRDQLGIDKYSIVFGNEKRYFKIETRDLGNAGDSNWKFLVLKTTNTPIVRDPAAPNILLTVRAVDRAVSGDSVRDEETKILITVEDQNNQKPVFAKIPTRNEVSESTPLLSPILTVRATDKDDGRNGGVYYYLDPLNDFFAIDPITGAIRVVRTLNTNNRPTVDVTLNVVASDRGRNPLKTTQNVLIVIQNVPNYPLPFRTNVDPNSPPTFPDGPYSFKVREDFPAKAVVLIIRAVDRDREQLRYRLIGGSGDFGLNEFSGVLTLERTLDYEAGRKLYNMEVEVRDSSNVPVKTKLDIEIQDVDENYNSPVFDENNIQKVASVRESAGISASVVTVTATDADSTGSDGQISYSITGGTGVGVFGIDSNSGRITTLTPLNRDLMASYKLIVNATDKAVFPRTSSMFLIVDVLDVDFNFPEFTKPIYIASVPERMPSDTFVTAVRAVDKDGQPVSYELSDSNFKIESTTGVIRTAKVLDASSVSSYQLDVVARTSTPERKSHAQVNVTVTTKENAPPKFIKSKYAVSLPENQGRVPNLLCIAAFDNNNNPVKYSIISGAVDRIKLDPDNGQLSATGSFNYEVTPGYKLQVGAQKQSNAASSVVAPATVDITIQEEIDIPKFQKNSYVVEIDEDLPLSTTVLNGFVIQDDDTTPDKFECSMVNIQSEAALITFNVVQSGDSCKLVTLRALDYSIANEFRFDVRATDKNFDYMYATTSVKVLVKDKNNHKPEFSQASYWTSVSSNTAAGQSLLTVEAKDDDFDKNAIITYSLLSSADSSRFSLDGNSGVLKAEASLEKNKKYTLTITAKDSGDPKKESSVQVYVSVYDTSVDSIRFTNKPCQATVNENVGFGTSVLTVTSSGPGSARYTIVGGDNQNNPFFSINQGTGEVKTSRNLDYEFKGSYKLAIRAKYDATPEMADDIVCSVTIKDVDDMKPKFAFYSEPEKVTVEGYTPAGTNIIKARTFDPDSATVTYSIDASASSSGLPFIVDPVTGQISTKSLIKYSKGSSYTIILQATDSAGQVSNAKILVTVIDMPRPPKFPTQNFVASVREVDRPGDQVVDIAATYSDPNINNPFLKYSITKGNEDKAFCINRNGLITIARPLDREKVPNYNLDVMVEKGRWNDTATVKVNIQDINDRSPQFTPYRYEETRLENYEINSEILRVTANDKDGGSNGEVTYTLLQPVDKRSEDVFEVKSTGAVVLKGKLDYEQLREHILFIKAKDGGSQSLSSVTEVRIKVKNENDNFPVFSATRYRAKVALDTPVNAKIIQLSATDQDYAGTNEQNFNFTIIDGNTEDAFQINKANGLITLKKSLAMVSATKFELKVAVSDNDGKLSKVPAIVELNVYLPDGPPKFSEPRVTINVKEGIPANGKVALVRAATSEALTYTILQGNINNIFKMESSSGAILATRTLDAEERKKYELLIRAQDTRDRSAQVTVVINVENINDNAPTIPDEVNNNLDRRVIGDILVDDVVTSLEAYDKDGDSIKYKINTAAEKYFYVDNKGLLRAKRTLDELGSTYLLAVTTEDDGSPPLKKNVNVRLVFVRYRPDQQPVRVDVSEDVRPGTKLARVPRVFPGGKLSIVFPKISNFTIDNEGWVRNVVPLDYEEKRFYSLTSLEVDSKGRKNYVDVEITVLDVNDNGPEFNLVGTFASVNQNSRSGAEVYKLSAYDKDSGSSGIVGYQIVSKNQPFTINPFTQVVETVDRLDFAKYNWTALAFDFGIPRRMSDPVSIDIATTSIPPRFNESSYEFKVDEHSPTGTIVGRVVATSDSGLRIGYTIIEGNAGNRFRINSQGQIFVNYIFDFEKDPVEYNLKVRAIELIPDKFLQSEVDVKIEVENVNDNKPQFESLLYKKSVKENVPPGTSVLKVSAKDCDCSKSCICSLGQLKYSLSDDFFTVDADSGIIRTKKDLDYEKTKLHVFRVYATDFGKNKKPNNEMCVVEITVDNTNDNVPEFLKRDYSIHVAEGATQNKALAAFQARDLDGDDVTYSISSGSSPFSVDSSTGILKLVGTIPSDKTQYSLRIRAEDQDGKHGSDTRVVIKIEDTNNHRPKFTNCNKGQVEVSVEENQPSSKVYQVKATDEDRGRNGEIEYGLEQLAGSLFKIDNSTGEITTTASLDREKESEKKSFKLFVWAQDGGHGSKPAERLISYCTVTVNKADQNDNYPIFLTRTYDGSVWNKAPIGTSILSVSASDEDEGTNQEVRYTMQQSTYFQINVNTGLITTKGDLSSTTSAFTETLTVTASNTQPMVGAPAQPPESKTNVQITISPNQPPEFERNTYTASVREDVPVNRAVVTVKAVAKQNDPATGKPYSVIYNLIKANKIAAESFKIQSDGLISTAGTLNYEQTKEFRLQVRAVVEGEDNRLYATATVIIKIEDVNDDSPTFVVSYYQARVLENENPGVDVITVEAEDLDTGAGGQVEYLLSDKNKDSFSIAATTGTIKTTTRFDRETTKSYYVQFDARDKGPNGGISASSYASVTVVDENDNKPMFNQTVYERTVKEDSPLGASIMEVVASDKDIGENARLDYFIFGDDGAAFGMETKVKPRNYGLLSVVQPLDYESKKEYVFEVIATDRKDSARATIKIKVNDANDNAPMFERHAYNFTMKEQTGPGVPVWKVKATDVDTKLVQKPITYSLDNNGLKYFTIDPNSGQIKTSSTKIDREDSSVYFFTVKAYDGVNTGTADVKVILTDINDNAPEFPNKPYIGYVEETKPPQTSVLVVQAIDKDDPNVAGNTDITYSLENDAGGRFTIEPATGLIKTLTTFDRETTPNTFIVVVKGTDRGNPRLSGTTEVKINVLDVNDHTPVISPTKYYANVPEDSLPGYSVAEIKVTDQDAGPNAEFEFVIVDGSDPNRFYIDPRNGTVFVSGMLDFETQKSYLLNITVRDRGNPERMAKERAYVFINIDDTNDNAPEFVPKEYNITIKEDEPKGKEVLTVTARDADSTTNSELSFSITGGNDDDLFDIKTSTNNAKQGVIFITESLDREKIPYFELEITVRDGGGLTGKGIVRVTLLDVNDNGPHFVPAWYEAKIKENLDQRQTVTRLSAYDPDEKSNGAPFSFSIVNGTKGNNFRLQEPTNVTSMVYSFGMFDREERPEWKLGVTAVDSGSPKMSNFTYVYVDVGDENDNEPFPGKTFIIVNVYNTKNPKSFVGGIIGKPYYKDEDYDGDVNDYRMDRNKYFAVDPQNGNIQMTAGTPLGRYEFKVDITESTRGKVRNGANFPKTVRSSVSVLVRSITNNDRKNSFAIQFWDMRKVGYFVGDYYEKFLKTISRIFGVATTNVVIFSIQKPKEETRLPAINVVLAIRKSRGGHIMVYEALTTLFSKKDLIESLGLKIGSIGIDQCAKENQKVGKCRNKVDAFNNFTVASGDYGQIPAPAASITIVSVFVNLVAHYESIIGPIGNCTPNPCLNNGKCHVNLAVGDISKGYVCECPDNFRGPECQLTTRTFYGNSYIWLPKLDAYENSMIELEMSTRKPNGLLLYQGPLVEGGNNGLKDFMAVALVEGRIQVYISLGRTPVTLTMTKGPKLNDGEWHIIQVYRKLKAISIIIDKCEKAEVISKDGKLVEDTAKCLFQGSVKGQSVYLNGFGPLQIGGTENELQYPSIPYQKFEGCIRNIKDNGQMYDLTNPLRIVNAPVGCQLANRCPDCNGKGYCEPLWNRPSICVCNLGYSGTYCNARAKATYYLPNSFTQYLVKSSKKRRELVPAPVSLKNEYYTNIALQVKVSENSSDCVIFLSTNSLGTEFNRIDVKNHILRYTFRLGNRMKTLKIPQINITDNKYHSVVVRRQGNRASLQIDYDGKVEGNTGGSHRLLNLGGGSFFSGGLPNITVVQVVEAIVASGGNAIIRNPQGQIVASGTGAGSSAASLSLISVGSNGNVFYLPPVVNHNLVLIRAYQKMNADGGHVNYYGHHSQSSAKDIYRNTLNTKTSSSGYFTIVNDGALVAGGPVRNRGLVKSAGGTAFGSGTSTGTTGVAVAHSAGQGEYGYPIQHVLPPSAAVGTSTGSGTSTGAAADKNEPITVIGDFGGCTAATGYNGMDLESDPSIEVRRQNVVNGCPCEAGFCLHGGTCVNAVPPYCICPPGWEGLQCQIVTKSPMPGTRPGTMFANPGVIAVVLVVLLAIVFIIGAVLLKRRPVPVKEVLVDDGHVHDNIRVYHDDGAGEEDNFGYDINQLMKYTYIENGGIGVGEGEALVGAGRRGRGGYGSGEAEITLAEEKPLLTSGADNTPMQHGITTITRRRVIHPDSIDVGQFIDTRVIEANREYTLALDSIHIYKYEGDDDDVDDLSELGDSGDEEEADDIDFQFLQDWGSKFDNLNRIFNED